MELKDVTEEDYQWIWECRNDIQTRLNSINMNPIPYQNHVMWMRESLLNSERKIYVAWLGESRVGVLRIDIKDESAQISINVSPNHRGQGIGLRMLQKLEKTILCSHKSIKRLVAIVKLRNEISLRLFKTAGYNFLKEENDIIKLEKIITD